MTRRAADPEMPILFSNRGRPLKVLAALFLLAGCCLYAAHATYWECKSPADCLAHPERCDGRELVAGTSRIAAVTSDGFSILSGNRPVFFQGNFPELAPGKFLDIEAVFHAPNRFQATAVHIYLERTIKIWGSLAAALIVAGLVAWVFWRKGF